MEEFTDADVDQLLERFDQTDPKLQRRIVVRFAQMVITASRELLRWEAAVGCSLETAEERARQGKS